MLSCLACDLCSDDASGGGVVRVRGAELSIHRTAQGMARVFKVGRAAASENHGGSAPIPDNTRGPMSPRPVLASAPFSAMPAGQIDKDILKPRLLDADVADRQARAAQRVDQRIRPHG